MRSKKVACLFCEKLLRKTAAKLHGCAEKKEAELRVGAPLAVYDAVQSGIENETGEEDAPGLVET
jgi:hypothetical protein